MERNLARVEEDRNRLGIRLQASERQADLLKMQIDQERLKHNDIENLLAKERIIQRQADIKIQGLENERNELIEKVKHLTQKIVGKIYLE